MYMPELGSLTLPIIGSFMSFGLNLINHQAVGSFRSCAAS